jgi:hypothetical protein
MTSFQQGTPPITFVTKFPPNGGFFGVGTTPNIVLKRRPNSEARSMTKSRVAFVCAASLMLIIGGAPISWGEEITDGIFHRVSEINAEITRGRMIAPVPLTIPDDVDPQSVFLGSYIVEAVATCNSCHSNKEYTVTGNPFNGQPKQVNQTCYLNGGQSLGPNIVSRNITPDNRGRPAGLTFVMFKNLMRTGNDPEHPGTLLQVMPWDGFQNMTNTELKAIYDYLSSIPSLPTGGVSPC